MKLIEFYRLLNEKAKPEEKPEDEKVDGPVKPEPPAPEPPAPEPVKPEVPTKPSKGVTDEFRTQIDIGFKQFGCPYLFTVKTKNQTKLDDLVKKGTNPSWQEKLKQKIIYVEDFVKLKDCEEKTKVEPTPVTKKVTPVVEPKTSPEIETKTTPAEKEIQTKFEQPKVIPEPVVDKEEELRDVSTIQTNEFLDDITVELDREIINQLPEVQKRLEEFKIDGEKMSYVIPLTLESKDFMMELEMNGVKLPYLMLFYENIGPLYDAIENNTYVDYKKLAPLRKRVNYKEFWDWTDNLWTNSNDWLKTKLKGTIPEFDKSTILP